jgi:hypothetical protein
MIDNILTAIRPQLIILSIIYFAVLAVIFLDLWSGIRKAKKRKEYRSSYGLRRTVDKISRYFNMLFVITIIDAIQMLAIWQLNGQTSYTLPTIPILTFVGAIFVGFIELKSIYESNDQKERAKINEVAKIAGKVIKERDTQEIVAALFEYMKTEKPKENG